MKGFWKNGFPPERLGEAIVWALKVHVGKMFAGPVQLNGAGVVGFALTLIGVVSLLGAGQRRLVAVCVLPYGLHFVAALLGKFPYGMYPRIEQHLVPGYCLLAGAGLGHLVDRFARTRREHTVLMLIGTAAFVFIGMIVSARDWSRPYHDEHARWAAQVAGHLREQWQPGDRIVLASPPTNVCLRWQLLPFTESIIEGDAKSGGGRTWTLHPQFDTLRPDQPEPPVREIPIGSRWRFRGTIVEGTQSLRCFCDITLSETK